MSVAYAMGQTGGQAGQAGGLAGFLPIIILFAIFYFLSKLLFTKRHPKLGQ